MSMSGAYNIGYYATPTPRGRENTTRLYNSSFNIAYGTPIIPIKCKGGEVQPYVQILDIQ